MNTDLKGRLVDYRLGDSTFRGRVEAEFIRFNDNEPMLEVTPYEVTESGPAYKANPHVTHFVPRKDATLVSVP